MKIIVLHDGYNNEPIIIRVDAIVAVQKRVDRVNDDSTEEYSCVYVGMTAFNVREHIDVVMSKIKNAEK